MPYIIEISRRSVTVELSAAAEDALRRRATPLLAEMELYFSCFLRKRVRFREPAGDSDEVWVGERLAVRFRSVMTRNCKIAEAVNETPLTEFPIVNAAAFIPHWLRIDYRRERWQGEFGYR